MDNPIYKWMISRGTPHFRPPFLAISMPATLIAGARIDLTNDMAIYCYLFTVIFFFIYT